ncbi:hypothetical protein L208DRAFT_1456098 [Tricholoma matsutake]|nr:hypothetical protein L208DRAFT_1456098 [Tricholoma matsutake 945]
MATAVVERPLSALIDTPVSPQRRPRASSVVEVIDVDSVDEPINVSSRPAARSQGGSLVPSPDVISVSDSDDDDFLLAQPVATRSNHDRSRQPTGQRHRLFSPPPPPPDRSVPDVPRIPRRYSGFSSLPMRQRPPPFPSPPVRARDQPFDFEADIHQATPAAGPSNINRNRRRRSFVSPPDLTAAPPSHHTPTMGLGGGLISINRAQVNNRRELHRDRMHDRGVIGRAGSAMRRLYTAIIGNNDDDGFFGPHDDDDYPAIQMLLAQDLGLEPGDNDVRFDHPARPYVWQEILFRGRRHGRREDDYKPEYTHPGKPESGFTFDFAPSSPAEASSSSLDTKGAAPIVIDLEAMDMETDTPGTGPSIMPSSSSGPSGLHTLLVCAKCLDPLVLGAGLVGDEARTQKVWALRCGHLIDGKCLDLVGVPDMEHGDQEKRFDDDGNGKGTDKLVDYKGKGKAVEARLNSPEANPIRSRLRSSALLPSTSSPVRSAVSPLPPQPHLGKRKRTSSSSKNKIEATHQWECPVAGCKHVHVSVKMGGVWVPEPNSPISVGKGKGKWSLAVAQAEERGGRGAVAVFV